MAKRKSSPKASPRTAEVNFDGIVGPTHNYSGLSFGNIASTSHKQTSSHPKEAALQGLKKMKFLMDLGVAQAVLPPQERPFIAFLRRLGYSGTDTKILEKVGKEAPELLANVTSASSMWTANAATVSPSADTADGKVHFTPANLASKFHRCLEPETTSIVLKAIFKSPKHFAHHPPLAGGVFFGDEGAANHTRFSAHPGKKGVELFVYGREAFRARPEPRKFPARQTREASAANARNHLLDDKATLLIPQNPDAIDAGVFHNDVASVGHEKLFFFHELSFQDARKVTDELSRAFRAITGENLHLLRVANNQISLEDCIKSYLFNSQIVTLPEGHYALIAPIECAETPSVKRFLDSLISDGGSPLRVVHYVDLRQSMQNGGGPACLRLRVVLTETERKKAHQGVFLTDKLYARLVKWVEKHYRDQLSPDDLRDPQLLKESRAALSELTTILKLGSLYSFQR